MIIERRYTIGSPDGPKSYNWMIIVKGSDVYIMTRGSPSNSKISLHETGQCHWQHGFENGGPIGKYRPIEWDRRPTPDAGALGVSFALQLVVPTDLLSAAHPARKPKKTHWIEPAPPGKATGLNFYFTNDKEREIKRSFSQVEPKRHLFNYIKLQNGERLAIEMFYADAGEFDMVLPANKSRATFRFSSYDPMKTGLPARIVLAKLSEDKEVLRLYELGGYRVEDTDTFPSDLPVFQPTEIKYSSL